MPSMLDRLTALASRALKPSPPTTPPSEGAPRGWKDTVRDAVNAVTASPAPPDPGSSQLAGTAPTLTPPPASPTRPPAVVGLTPPAADEDRAALARYQYLLQTAPPAQLEHIHTDAFTRLTPDQRDDLHQQLRISLPPGEQPRSASPAALARTATRAEASHPGLLARILARTPGPRTAGITASAAGGGLLVAVAGGAIASAIAVPLLADAVSAGVDFDALAGAVDVQGITDGVSDVAAGATEQVAGGVSDLAAGVTEQVAGVGEHLTGVGEQISTWEIPGLGDIFGR
ncbi:cation-transporting ATPase [Microbacterium sp. SCN 69-37]|mgnify:CR=1 FL=1|uniref:cation-transporting ATPase n=1 Tax=Microbacterium sp. SCN 69-37 TaxID=1660115 RepID=UPI00086B33D2|nr:cation-transporting ATPase [Microbacterium sp. SCN 69-37]ODT25704.1 MAG: hypothetical protein ABS64_01120 [Microbacterium sp. SCN 69-37]